MIKGLSICRAVDDRIQLGDPFHAAPDKVALPTGSAEASPPHIPMSAIEI